LHLDWKRSGAVREGAIMAFAAQRLANFVVEGRMGRRRREPGYYGCNSAVFDVHEVSQPEVKLALKVVYNMEEVSTVDLSEHFQTDFSFLEDPQRVPVHDSILCVLGHFTDTATAESLPGWDVDAEFVRESSLFVVLERMDGSLQQLLSERRSAGREPPLTGAEFLEIATQLSSAVAHLFSYGVIHRDIKPDNVLYRCGDDADAAPIAFDVKLADFGEALDAHQYCEDSSPGACYKMSFPAPCSRGGATYYLPPEVRQVQPGRQVTIDYTKSDVWALGLVIYAMLSPDEPFTSADYREFSAETYR
jgi:serine/threonine protein kinase